MSINPFDKNRVENELKAKMQEVAKVTSQRLFKQLREKLTDYNAGGLYARKYFMIAEEDLKELEFNWGYTHES